MKKKILTLSLVVALAATAIIGGTMAYFTDKDEKTNTFTMGNVDIELEEKFPEDELIPGEENALQKEVTVKNVGSENAYMWIELLIPAELDTPQDAGQNDLHFNPFDTYKDSEGNLYVMRGSEAKAKGYTLVAETVEEYLGQKTIGEGDDAVIYNVYREYIKNDTPKETSDSTYALLARVFMDKDVKQCTDTTHTDGCLVLKDGTHYTGTWEIIVNAYGIQGAGFETIEEAIAAYDGEK